MRKVACLAVVAAGLVLVLSGTAGAATLGSTTAWSGGFGSGGCFAGDAFDQNTQDSSTPYFVPAGGGRITRWSTNTSRDIGGANLTFLVMKPNADGSATVIGADSETLPSPLPASGVVTFPLTTPITAVPGETLGLYSSDAGNPDAPVCYWSLAPGGDSINPFVEPSTPAANQTLSPDTGIGPSPAGYTLNVAATLAVTVDAQIAAGATPSSTSLGNVALLASTVTDAGPGSDAITFVDTVPNGLSIVLAQAGGGSCSVSGQQVACSVSGLTPGQSAPVDILVKPTTTGRFTNTASVGLPAEDADSALGNNTSSATLTVGAAASVAKCVVPNLHGQKLAFAKRMLHLLACKTAVRHAHSKSVAKGRVIRTKPGAGTYAHGRKITIVVSSGPKKGRRHATRQAFAFWPL